MIKRVRLIAWDPDDAKRRADELEREGVVVDASPLNPSGLVSQLRDVIAVCIDLDKLPSHGREIAVAMRQTKATKFVPIIFAGGAKHKIPAIKKDLPDATYIDWPAAAFTLRKLIKRGEHVKTVAEVVAALPVEPVKPPSHMERYAGSSLEKKLGLAAGMKVVMVGEPGGFEELLGELPEGVKFVKKMNAETKLVLWFVRARLDVENGVAGFAKKLAPGAALWIIYPKKAGKFKTDLNQADVRSIALKAGLVDYKICAVDDDWSGLKFTRKK